MKWVLAVYFAMGPSQPAPYPQFMLRIPFETKEACYAAANTWGPKLEEQAGLSDQDRDALKAFRDAAGEFDIEQLGHWYDIPGGEGQVAVQCFDVSETKQSN